MFEFLKGSTIGLVLGVVTGAGLATGMWIPVAVMWSVIIGVVALAFAFLHLVYGRR